MDLAGGNQLLPDTAIRAGMWAEGGEALTLLPADDQPSSPPPPPPRTRRRYQAISGGDGRERWDFVDADSSDEAGDGRRDGPGGLRDRTRRWARKRWMREARVGWQEGNNREVEAESSGPPGDLPGMFGAGGGEAGGGGIRGLSGSNLSANAANGSRWRRGDNMAVASISNGADGQAYFGEAGMTLFPPLSLGTRSWNGIPAPDMAECQEGGVQKVSEDSQSGIKFCAERHTQIVHAPNGNVNAVRRAEVLLNAGVHVELAEDPLYKIFSFLDQQGLCRAAMVCRQWRASSGLEEFWKHLDFEGRKVTHQDVTRLCAKYPNALTLNLKGATCVDEVLVQDAMQSLVALKTLVLGNGFLSDDFFWALSEECQQLRILKVSEAVLGLGGTQEIQIRHNGLQELEIVGCRVLRLAIRCSALQKLSLKRSTAASAILVCPELTDLNVSHCHKLTDSGVRAAAAPACPQLTNLDISNCPYVSDETLREIAAACPSLARLNASQCPNISLEGVRMHSMVELNLAGCEGINTSSMTPLEHCRLLETLNLDHCSLLSTVTLELPRLKTVSLNQCKKLTEVTVRSPGLVAVDVTDCTMLSCMAVASSEVETLALKRQLRLSSISLRCPRLRQVDLSECDSLTNSVFEAFCDGGGCPKLTSLILDGCEGLTVVKLVSRQLEQLSLVGCCNINAIDLVCPSLTSALLDGCDRLASASLAPVALSDLNLGICPHLAQLKIQGTAITQLDLRGCGALSEANLACPQLVSLDASYCSHLGDSCLAAIAENCSSVQTLVLAACPNVTAGGLLALKKLPALTTLDLSYTFLTDLAAVFEACTGLQVLQLSACKYLQNDALKPLHRGLALPRLKELDISYGSLEKGAVEELLELAPHLVTISLNGCEHISDDIWHRISLPLVVDEDMNEVGEATPNMEINYPDNVAEARQSRLEPSVLKVGRNDCQVLAMVAKVFPGVPEGKARGTNGGVEGGCGLFSAIKLEAQHEFWYQARIKREEMLTVLEEMDDVVMSELDAAFLEPSLQGAGPIASPKLDLSYSSSMQRETFLTECMAVKEQDIAMNRPQGGGGRDEEHGNSERNEAEAMVSAGLHFLNAEEQVLASMGVSAESLAELLRDENERIGGVGPKAGGLKQRTRKLQVLNAVGCSTLRSVCLSDSAACSSLSSLNLSLAQNLRRVQLACPNLNFLNLSNCSSLAHIQLDCPRLTSLCLQGCALDEKDLEQGVSGCPQLETLDIRNCPKVSTDVLNKVRASFPGVRRLYHSLLG